jgi:hypothetical protein
MPSIRLALARYQPVSASGAHLSATAITEIVQLTNDRLATVTQRGPLRYRIGLFGVAIATGAAARRQPGTVDLLVERLGEGDDEEFGWTPLTGVVFGDPEGVRPVSGRAGAVTANTVGTGAASTTMRPVAEPSVLALSADAQTLLRERNFAQLIGRGPLLSALAMPEILDRELTLPRAPDPGERFRVTIAEGEPRAIARVEAIGEATAGSSRIVYLEMFPLERWK